MGDQNEEGGVRGVDVQIGRQLRRRRRLMGMTQADLAHRVGVAPQQIQKYECGGARMSAARLFDVAQSLEAPIDYFFAGLGRLDPQAGDNAPQPDVLGNEETQELIKAYYGVPARSRRHLLDLAKALNADAAPPKVAGAPRPRGPR